MYNNTFGTVDTTDFPTHKTYVLYVCMSFLNLYFVFLKYIYCIYNNIFIDNKN